MPFFSGKRDSYEDDNLGIDWVVHYVFDDVEHTQAIREFQELIDDLHQAGLYTQVRHGHGNSLLVCVKVPRDLLGNMIHKSRIKDFLHCVINEIPYGDEHTIADAETPAEELRSVYHAVSWQKALGGAGITPGFGKWKNVASAFPLHNQPANGELLRKWSRTTTLTAEDLDAIRALFGEKVAFYFAFIHCYSCFLVFPAAWGVFCWYYFGPYSITFAVVNCLWCIVFVEFWKIRELDLSMRWNVKDVGTLKVNRKQYVWDKEVTDPITGQVNKVFSSRKQFLRQLLLIPFASSAAVALGSLIVITFAMEVFISDVYHGSLKMYLEFLPTVLFSLTLPAITNLLTHIASQLTEYENYRTQDQYDLAQTQKTFVMNFITDFLPTILTAFVYVPFGPKIVPYLDVLRMTGLKQGVGAEISVDTSRLQQEVISLSMTAQVVNFGEEIVLPFVKRMALQKWREYKLKRSKMNRHRSHSTMTDMLLIDPSDEQALLNRIRNESEADEYNVHDDILEMCIQFGYLALFGVAWPLVPLGFLLNNWLELRGDFFKLSLECQRPPPIRADSIGPSLQGLEFLTWLGTLSTAAIVYLYRNGMQNVRFSYLLLTILIAEQTYLAAHFAVRVGLEKLWSSTLRLQAANRFRVRKGYLEAFNATSDRSSPSSSSSPSRSTRIKPKVRFNERVNVYSSTTDDGEGSSGESVCTEETDHGILYSSEREAQFWSWTQRETADAGVRLIKALSTVNPEELDLKREKAKGS
ncbi:anoctamin family protein [Aspergillus glaucus CBS 516.65]|uniref:Uncharacterized protein n=1 Tax=Aspergillus glaucus CBS 516.65 TaxID=1160497 RepID=A0A1L9VXQ9_ASPGL|nr:hypothetical protein ASPGLDRAFT_63524 [Aspergillus glaucus CBS 516.65]OJJ88700.1 hypothetical protein ASPGLDRAFT_63524 [Aspergillus glaucus CBS 516.65]